MSLLPSPFSGYVRIALIPLPTWARDFEMARLPFSQLRKGWGMRACKGDVLSLEAIPKCKLDSVKLEELSLSLTPVGLVHGFGLSR